MRWLLLSLIRTYQWLPLIPRGRCIFAESCSRYVYRRTEESGTLAGMGALLERARQCRPGYRAIITPTGELGIQLADGHVVPARAMRLDISVTAGGLPVELGDPVNSSL